MVCSKWSIFHISVHNSAISWETSRVQTQLETLLDPLIQFSISQMKMSGLLSLYSEFSEGWKIDFYTLLQPKPLTLIFSISGKVDEKATQLHAIASLKVLLDATKPQDNANGGAGGDTAHDSGRASQGTEVYFS